jgi:hypothetical protein
MSRAIAKQCQMDPKVYLPLLEQFEAVGSMWKGVASAAVEDETSDRLRVICACLMRFRVLVHLKKHSAAADWGMRTLSLWEDCAHALPDVTMDGLRHDLLEVIENNDLQESSVTIIRGILDRCRSRPPVTPFPDSVFTPTSIPCPRNDATIGATALKRLLVDVLSSLGAKYSAMGRYRDATCALLCSDPPHVNQAIQAARNNKDWQLALAIARRYAGSVSGALSASEVAESIVDSFQGELEQGQSESDDYFAFFPSSVDFSALSKERDQDNGMYGAIDEGIDEHKQTAAVASAAAAAGTEGDRSLEIAQICIDYLDRDVDRAAEILVSARRWTEAVHVVLKYDRPDLLTEVPCCAFLLDDIL